MQTPDILISRIEHLNEGLSQAVQAPGGAQFAMMLSMLWDSQYQGQTASVPVDGTNGVETLPQRNDLYTPELVGRMNQSLRSGLMGDVYLHLSWLDTAPLRHMVSQAESSDSSVPLPQAAVLAKQYTVLDEVRESQHRIAA